MPLATIQPSAIIIGLVILALTLASAWAANHFSRSRIARAVESAERPSDVSLDPLPSDRATTGEPPD